MTVENIYRELGVSDQVYAYGERILASLKERFEAIDQVAEYNQMKVIKAMQENRVSDIHFAATTGYGYNDLGRDTLESVYASAFHGEAALVRPQLTSGTTRSVWLYPAICARGMSFSPRWESPTTRWRRLSASASPSAP